MIGTCNKLIIPLIKKTRIILPHVWQPIFARWMSPLFCFVGFSGGLTGPWSSAQAFQSIRSGKTAVYKAFSVPNQTEIGGMGHQYCIFYHFFYRCGASFFHNAAQICFIFRRRFQHLVQVDFILNQIWQNCDFWLFSVYIHRNVTCFWTHIYTL